MRLKQGLKEEDFIRELDCERIELTFIRRFLDTAEFYLPEMGFDRAMKMATKTTRNAFGEIYIKNELPIIEKYWLYGDELKDWYGSGFSPLSKTNDIIITHHAKERLHKRNGLNSKAQKTTVLRAWKNGYLIGNNENASTEQGNRIYKLYHDSVYVFAVSEDGIFLLTVMDTPREYKVMQPV